MDLVGDAVYGSSERILFGLFEFDLSIWCLNLKPARFLSGDDAFVGGVGSYDDDVWLA